MKQNFDENSLMLKSDVPSAPSKISALLTIFGNWDRQLITAFPYWAGNLYKSAAAHAPSLNIAVHASAHKYSRNLARQFLYFIII